jgi:hypothetical protein
MVTFAQTLALLEVGMAQLMLATDKVHPLGQ